MLHWQAAAGEGYLLLTRGCDSALAAVSNQPADAEGRDQPLGIPHEEVRKLGMVGVSQFRHNNGEARRHAHFSAAHMLCLSFLREFTPPSGIPAPNSGQKKFNSRPVVPTQIINSFPRVLLESCFSMRANDLRCLAIQNRRFNQHPLPHSISQHIRVTCCATKNYGVQILSPASTKRPHG